MAALFSRGTTPAHFSHEATADFSPGDAQAKAEKSQRLVAEREIAEEEEREARKKRNVYQVISMPQRVEEREEKIERQKRRSEEPL